MIICVGLLLHSCQHLLLQLGLNGRMLLHYQMMVGSFMVLCNDVSFSELSYLCLYDAAVFHNFLFFGCWWKEMEHFEEDE
jgi:hypothetical protein